MDLYFERCQLWMGNLKPYMTEVFLIDTFKELGYEIVGFRIIKNKLSGDPIHCFLQFKDSDVALEVLNKLDGTVIPHTYPIQYFDIKVANMSIKDDRPYHGVWVGNITPNVDEKMLCEFFGKNMFNVKSVKIVRNNMGISKGFGFVEFFTHWEQKAAIYRLNRCLGFGNMPLVVRDASNKYSANNKNDTPIKIETYKICLQNLHLHMKNSDIHEYFKSKFISFKSCKTPVNENGNCKGYSIVNFFTQEDQELAVKVLNGACIFGKDPLIVKTKGVGIPDSEDGDGNLSDDSENDNNESAATNIEQEIIKFHQQREFSFRKRNVITSLTPFNQQQVTQAEELSEVVTTAEKENVPPEQKVVVPIHKIKVSQLKSGIKILNLFDEHFEAELKKVIFCDGFNDDLQKKPVKVCGSLDNNSKMPEKQYVSLDNTSNRKIDDVSNKNELCMTSEAVSVKSDKSRILETADESITLNLEAGSSKFKSANNIIINDEQSTSEQITIYGRSTTKAVAQNELFTQEFKNMNESACALTSEAVDSPNEFPALDVSKDKKEFSSSASNENLFDIKLVDTDLVTNYDFISDIEENSSDLSSPEEQYQLPNQINNSNIPTVAETTVVIPAQKPSIIKEQYPALTIYDKHFISEEQQNTISITGNKLIEFRSADKFQELDNQVGDKGADFVSNEIDNSIEYIANKFNDMSLADIKPELSTEDSNMVQISKPSVVDIQNIFTSNVEEYSFDVENDSSKIQASCTAEIEVASSNADINSNNIPKVLDAEQREDFTSDEEFCTAEIEVELPIADINKSNISESPGTETRKIFVSDEIQNDGVSTSDIKLHLSILDDITDEQLEDFISDVSQIDDLIENDANKPNELSMVDIRENTISEFPETEKVDNSVFDEKQIYDSIDDDAKKSNDIYTTDIGLEISIADINQNTISEFPDTEKRDDFTSDEKQIDVFIEDDANNTNELSIMEIKKYTISEFPDAEKRDDFTSDDKQIDDFIEDDAKETNNIYTTDIGLEISIADIIENTLSEFPVTEERDDFTSDEKQIDDFIKDDVNNTNELSIADINDNTISEFLVTEERDDFTSDEKQIDDFIKDDVNNTNELSIADTKMESSVLGDKEDINLELDTTEKIISEFAGDEELEVLTSKEQQIPDSSENDNKLYNSSCVDIQQQAILDNPIFSTVQEPSEAIGIADMLDDKQI